MARTTWRAERQVRSIHLLTPSSCNRMGASRLSKQQKGMYGPLTKRGTLPLLCGLLSPGDFLSSIVWQDSTAPRSESQDLGHDDSRVGPWTLCCRASLFILSQSVFILLIIFSSLCNSFSTCKL